jgi:hypothetical protein
MAKKQPGKKRDSREPELQRGKALLAAWGIHEGTLPPGTSDQEVLSTLEPFIGKDPACDLLIAEWLGKLSSQQSADRLSQWEDSSDTKSLKREIRRSMFKLEQKGFKVVRQSPAAAPVSFAPAATGPEGYLGPVDGEGSRMAWLLKPGRGGVTGLLTVLSDVEGMIFVDAVVAKRSALMRTLKESSSTGPVVQTPWKYADALMHAAFKLAPPKPSNMRADYLLTRADMTLEQAEPLPETPDLSNIPAPVRSEDELLDNSADLFSEEEFRTWSLPQEIARKHIQEMMNSKKSGLVLSKQAATERAVGIMDDAMEEFLNSPLKQRFVTRLLHMAHLFQLQERTAPAQLAMIVASVLENPKGRDLKETSFMRALVFRAFTPYLAQGDPGPEEPETETAEGASRILDPSKVSTLSDGDEADPGAAAGDDSPPVIIRP